MSKKLRDMTDDDRIGVAEALADIAVGERHNVELWQRIRDAALAALSTPKIALSEEGKE